MEKISPERRKEREFKPLHHKVACHGIRRNFLHGRLEAPQSALWKSDSVNKGSSAAYAAAALKKIY